MMKKLTKTNMKTINLKDLQKEIPFKWRVQSYSKNKPKASCVAYIDARDVADRLDDVVGPDNWQVDYKTVGSLLLGGIGIKINEEWVWKWDTGSETQVEKDKGHVSDSFKRAGVQWGIGRFLYGKDIVYVDTDGAKTETHKYPSVIDSSGKKVWELTKHINGIKPPIAPKATGEGMSI